MLDSVFLNLLTLVLSVEEGPLQALPQIGCLQMREKTVKDSRKN